MTNDGMKSLATMVGETASDMKRLCLPEREIDIGMTMVGGVRWTGLSKGCIFEQTKPNFSPDDDNDFEYLFRFNILRINLQG